jgi:hypothetical protein
MSIFLGASTYSNNTISGASNALNITGNLLHPTANGSYVTSIGAQPVFNARGTGAFIYSTSFGGAGSRELGSPMGWVVTQQGTGFNTSTGRFTAPVAGNYYFHSSTYYIIDSNNTSGYIHYLLAKNGSQAWNNSRIPYNIYGHGELASFSDGINVSAIINLGVGDYVSVIPSWGGTIGSLFRDYTLFCGYLIG